MQFLFPGMLWALFLLGIPLLIHLFYFRRYQKVLFTNVHFLKELVEETSVRNRLRNLLVLLARLLALSFLILAFAQPFLKSEINNKNAIRTVGIYIDNSWSMEAASEEGNLIQRAKSRAKDILNAHSENDKFMVLTNDFEGKHRRLVSKEDAAVFIDEIKTGPAFQTLSTVLKKQKQFFQNASIQEAELYILSDFQKSMCDADTSSMDSLFTVKLIPLQSIRENNVSIDTAFFESPILLPGQQNQIVFQLTNHGVSLINELRTTLNLNGQEYPGPVLEIPAGKSITDTIPLNILNPGWQQITLKIKDYPIQFDDQYYLSCMTEQDIKILILYDGASPLVLQQAFQSIPYFSVQSQSVHQLDYSSFGDQKLIVLCDLTSLSTGLVQELQKATQEGTQVLIFPGPNIPSGSYDALNQILRLPQISEFSSDQKEGGLINMQADVFSDVFSNITRNTKLPATKGQYRFLPGAAAEQILSYRDGSAQLNRFKVNKSYVYFSASPFDSKYNELSKNAEFFIPLLFKAALNTENRQTLSYTIGPNLRISMPVPGIPGSQDQSMSLKGPEELVPSAHFLGSKLILDLFDQLRKAGIYELKNRDQLWGYLAFNDSRNESNPDCYTTSELSERFGGKAVILEAGSEQEFYSKVKSEKEGIPLWWWCLCASAFFIFCESILIRYLKPS